MSRDASGRQARSPGQAHESDRAGPEVRHVKKTRKKRRALNVARAAVFGDAASIARHLADSRGNPINASYVERGNLNWRLWDARLTRKALTFAKAKLMKK